MSNHIEKNLKILSKAGSNLGPLEDGEDGYVDFLLQASQSLWNESSIKGLVKKFLALLQDFFLLKEFGILSIHGEKTEAGEWKKFSLKNSPLRFQNVKCFSEDFLDKLKGELALLPLKGEEYREGINTIILSDTTVHFALMGDPAADWHLLVWTTEHENLSSRLTLEGQPQDVSPITDVKVMHKRARAHLGFLVRQLQSECRWVSKLDKTQALLYRDDLTGLFNYRYLDIALDSELRRAQRFQTSFSLLFLDLDNFKLVNDQYGHLIGSNLLKKVAETLVGTLREVDTIIRYGGDEYIIVLLGANSRRGFLTAERIRKALDQSIFRFEGDVELSITASIGVAAFPEHGIDKETLIRIADEMMYSSKRSGKNKVTLVGSEVFAAHKEHRMTD